MLFTLCYGAFFASLVAASPSRRKTIAPTVSLPYATYQGSTNGFVNHFLGMSYASPPLGDLRFRAPVDPWPVTEVQDATAFKNVCIGVNQTPGRSPWGGIAYGEDCLYISVSAPATATNISKLPVLFFISGGGFATLSNVNYNFDQFINTSGGNVVVVQANYRVGALGFLAGKEVAADGHVNAGLLDQRKALHWVKSYIGLFGGDPNHVVIFGASAGAGSVGLQMSAYGGRDDKLFVGAFADAAFYTNVNDATFQESQFGQLASTVGCGKAVSKLACLRGINITAFQVGNSLGSYPGQNMTSLFQWNAVVDGDFIQDVPLRLYQHGNFVKVPTIVGEVTDEGTFFAYNAATPAEVSRFMSANYPGLSTQNLSTINSLYPIGTPFPFHAAYFPSAAAAYGDAAFKCPGHLIAQSQSKARKNASVWKYSFNQGITLLEAAGYGVAHTTDLGAIFGPHVGPSTGILDVTNGITNGLIFGPYASENAALVPIMMGYTISFVRFLNPNAKKYGLAPTWNALNGSTGLQRLLVQNIGTSMEAIPAPFQSKCAFWNELLLLPTHV